MDTRELKSITLSVPIKSHTRTVLQVVFESRMYKGGLPGVALDDISVMDQPCYGGKNIANALLLSPFCAYISQTSKGCEGQTF